MKAFSTSIGHITQENRLGDGAGVIEVAGRFAARLAGDDPFLVMADRIGNRWLGAFEVDDSSIPQ